MKSAENMLGMAIGLFTYICCLFLISPDRSTGMRGENADFSHTEVPFVANKL